MTTNLLNSFHHGDSMFWITVSIVAGSLLIFIIAILVIIYVVKRVKRKSFDEENSKQWYPQNSITYGNFGTVKCIRSNVKRSESSSSNDCEESRVDELPSCPSGSLVQTTIQPSTFRAPLERFVSTHKRKKGSVGSSPIDGSSKDSDDDDNNDFSTTKGKIWFSAKYNIEEHLLYVEVIKAKYLKGRSMLYSPRDPFVRVYLLPDESNYYQTKVRQRTLSPKFKETFTFKVEYDNASCQSLKFVVYDFDKKNVRHSLGHAVIPLANIDLTSSHTICHELDDSIQKAFYIGEMLLSLCCDPYNDKIRATVIRLKNLHLKPNGKIPDVYVRVDLYHGRKLMKTKNSLMHPGGPMVEIQQTFSFRVSGRFLDSCSLAIAVKVRIRGEVSTDKSIGRIAVGPFMFARGQELIHWQEMLCNPRTIVEKWHSLCEA